MAIKLIDWITSPFRKAESLSAMLLPRQIIGRGVCPVNAVDFFEPFLHTLDESVRKVYRYSEAVGEGAYRTSQQDEEQFEVSEVREPLDITHTLKIRQVEISYSAFPIIGNRSPNAPNIYAGMLTIKQGKVDLQNAGELLNAMSPTSLLAYQSGGDPNFQVFHHRGKKTIAEGETLLDKLGHKPSGACEYLVVSGAVGWAYVDLEAPANLKD